MDSNQIQTLIQRRYNSGCYVQTLFDPIQTHALYGVRKEDKIEIRHILKDECGVTHIRMVNNGYGYTIICFKIKKNKANE